MAFLPTSCSCCGGLSGCTTCPVAPTQFQLTASGIVIGTDGICIGCATGYNGTFLLTNKRFAGTPDFNASCASPGSCVWISTENLQGCYGIGVFACAPLYELSIDLVGSDVLLTTKSASYSLAKSSFDCFGTNVFTKFFEDTSVCQGFPATLTVDAAP